MASVKVHFGTLMEFVSSENRKKPECVNATKRKNLQTLYEEENVIK